MNDNKYDPIIRKYATEYREPFHLVKAIIYCESSFRKNAESPCGAKGPMQLMPSVYEPEKIDPFDPMDNIRIGCKHLKRMWNIFGNEKGIERWKYAVASYNCGQGYVIDAQRVAKENKVRDDLWCYISVFLKDAECNGRKCHWQETVRYVDKVMQKMYDYVLEHISREVNV